MSGRIIGGRIRGNVSDERLAGWSDRAARVCGVALVPNGSRTYAAAVSDFGYDPCDEHICFATNLSGFPPGRLAEPGA